MQPYHNKNTIFHRRVINETLAGIIASARVNTRNTIHKILKDNKLHSCRMELNQKMNNNDFQQRMGFYDWKNQDSSDFQRSIFWSVELSNVRGLLTPGTDITGKRRIIG